MPGRDPGQPALTGTPAGWRIAAGLLLGGGLITGLLAAGSGMDRWLASGFAVLVSAGLAPIMWGSRRPPVAPEPVDREGRAELPTITVLVAARDEVSVLPRLIEDLAAQTHRGSDGHPRFDIIVVDDRSQDGTADAVRSAALAHGIADSVAVVRREGRGLIDGKGAALAAASPGSAAGDVIVVLDADARLDPDFLRRAAGYVLRGVPALTARRRVLRANASILATIQEDEETQDGELQRGRWAAGGCSEFRGNGMVIRRDLLTAVGGFRPGTLTEDLDLSTRLAAHEGITVAWALDLVVEEEAVPTWRGLWRQRLRWSEGAIRRFLEFGPATVRSGRLSRRARWDFAVYGVQLMAPPIILGAMLGAVVNLRPGPLPALIAIYLLAGGVLAFDALRWDRPDQAGTMPILERTLRSVRVAMFSAVWLVAVPGALVRIAVRRGRPRFDKTARSGTSG